MTEYLNDLLTVDKLLNDTLGLRDGFLHLDEVFRAVSADLLGYGYHSNRRASDYKRHPDAQIKHRGDKEYEDKGGADELGNSS